MGITIPADLVEWESTCVYGTIYGDSHFTCRNWFTYNQEESCYIKTTLNGNGRAKIDFGNCFYSQIGGVVTLFLDGNEIAFASAGHVNIVKEFDFTDGSELKLAEEHNGMISFNSFEVLSCWEGMYRVNNDWSVSFLEFVAICYYHENFSSSSKICVIAFTD